MAQDYSNVKEFPATKRFQLSSTSNRVTQITLPRGAGRIQLGSVNEIKVTHEGTDNTAIGSDYMFVPANNDLSIRLGRGNNRLDDIYVAATAASTFVSILFEEL